jgi:polyhydroxyalkanoate synthase
MNWDSAPEPGPAVIDKYIGFFENMDNKAFVEIFVRMEKWIFDSPDVPGETFRQFVKDLYHGNLLIQSKMMGAGSGGPEAITMPSSTSTACTTTWFPRRPATS